MIDKYDIETLERWLYLAKKYGTDAVKIVHGGRVHEFRVTVIDPERSIPMTGGKNMAREFLSEPEIEFLSQIAGEKIKKELIRQLQDSIKEEQEAIKAYENRGHYARNFPAIAAVYDHLWEEEKHHLEELQNAVEKLRKETK